MIPFTLIDWEQIPKTEKVGEEGNVTQRAVDYPGLKIRIVEYSAGFMADHWCQKGHIVYCLEGSFESEMESGEKFQLSKGMTYVVSDDMSSHRSNTESGTKLLIIDGDFLGM
ncbi:MAG TPA: DHCW motif cupin fold protein [Saprospiraceae bacterium]|nr:DHCW motif cupin fold protein [Saprospiraceae bacterium]